MNESFDDFMRQTKTELEFSKIEQSLQAGENIIPNRITDPIVDIAIDLVDIHKHSMEQSMNQLDRARFYIGAHEEGKGLPTLKINIPKEEFTDLFGWRAEFTFDYQDLTESMHLLINKDGTIRLSRYDDRNDQFLNQFESTKLLDELIEIKDTLVPDYDIA